MNADAGQADARRGMRDLMGLLSLSALWLGKDGATVLELMTQAVERLAPLSFSVVEARLLPGEAPRWFVRAGGVQLPDAAHDTWRAATPGWPKAAGMSASTGGFCDTPMGPMRVIRLELGVGAHDSGAWFGSNEPGFPSDTALAILRAAASLAATGLQAARTRHAQEEADRLKDEFLAMLGHELRNPLAPIRAGASIWQSDDVTPEQLKQTGAIIERQVQHMTHLVDDLLDVSRLSTGAIVLERGIVDIREVVALALEQTGSHIEGQGHVLATAIPDAAFPVDGDIKRLVQILANLLHNAAKYTPRGGRIALSVRASDSTVCVGVQDNGIGIEAAMMSRIFDLFTQVRRSGDRSDGGLGVGLALARRLVDLHGGTLAAASEGLGHGTRIEMSLPLAAPVASAPAPTAAAAPAPVALKVLVVDDNEDAGSTMGMLLEALGHVVRVVHHPLAALELAPVFTPDVFLLDIGLPDMDGYVLARRLQALPCTANARFVALTGFGQASDQRQAFEAGFHHHCTKPVELQVLDAIFTQIVVENGKREQRMR